MQVSVAHQRAACFKRRMQPFVRIERQRICGLDTVGHMAVCGRNLDQRANAAVNVEPDIFAAADFANGLQIINRTGVCCSRRGNHAGRTQACCAVLRDHLLQGRNIHAEISV